jgi:hypothetical protein
MARQPRTGAIQKVGLFRLDHRQNQSGSSKKNPTEKFLRSIRRMYHQQLARQY